MWGNYQTRPEDKIQPGDVFVKQWGKREIVLIMLPHSPNVAKQRYQRVGGGQESTWSTSRSAMEERKYGGGYAYKGTMPVELIELAAQGRRD